ncbi:MAG TPA: hypothetical protein VG013_28510 [Gemmataceae bacterium]|jgi:hypothetical protein|nr:hypothetical protein [Gemmataceae bacterium]
MDREPNSPAGASAPPVRKPWLCILVLVGLTAWQGWMTLTLFGPDHVWRHLTNDEPIIAGCHALHLYHGYLGAQAFCERGRLCCYDPAFQAGYPKTPVFDSGSRPAELFLTVAGGAYFPAAYKLGLALCCCLASVLLLVAARGVGLDAGASCLAVALGLLVWWGKPSRNALEAGDLDLLMGGLAALAFMGLLIHFHRRPDWKDWLGLVLTGWLAWFSQPFVCLLLVPLVLVYYLSVGTRHRLGWHAALVSSLAAGLAGNGFWLVDWAISWWIRHPLQFGSEALAHRTLHTVWSAPLWGDPADRVLALGLAALAAVGVWLLNRSGQRPAARLFGMGAGGLLALAVVGLAWEPLGRMGSSQLLMLGLWFAVLPAVAALVQVCRVLVIWAGSSRRAAAIVCGVLLPLLAVGHRWVVPLALRCCETPPLAVGLDPQRTALVERLRTSTPAEARVLWEDRASLRQAPRWTALLPVLTGRAYLGGLDPDGCIEHAYASLVDEALAGRSIADWSDGELEDFVRRYNIGSAVCWSPAAIARFRAWKGTVQVVPVADEAPGCLFVFRPRSFVLRGQAEVLCADRQRIALANVVPDDGQVVLSFHYQAGMQASPGRVQVEREPDPFDPIPFIRLRVHGPVARITLTWDHH